MDKNEFVKSLRCPWEPIAQWFAEDTDFVERFKYVKNTDKYDWNKMIPKVTYQDWIVCHYLVDDKLYRLDLEDCVIEEVVVVEILEYDEKFRLVDTDGNIIEEEGCHSYCDNFCCGESDDITCYIYFNLANE